MADHQPDVKSHLAVHPRFIDRDEGFVVCNAAEHYRCMSQRRGSRSLV